eukprot:6058017-Pyramimonas_sp.AAC.1
MFLLPPTYHCWLDQLLSFFVAKHSRIAPAAKGFDSSLTITAERPPEVVIRQEHCGRTPDPQVRDIHGPVAKASSTALPHSPRALLCRRRICARSSGIGIQ